MGVALLIGILIWFCMGNLIVRQKMPAFIITLGGLLIFKGLFWLVIHNSTIPIVQGGRRQPLFPADDILFAATARICTGRQYRCFPGLCPTALA